MTSHSENELLTRVGPGTAMGDLMRQVLATGVSVVGTCRQ